MKILFEAKGDTPTIKKIIQLQDDIIVIELSDGSEILIESYTSGYGGETDIEISGYDHLNDDFQ